MGIDFKTPAELRRKVEKILGWNTPVAFFPVRHHSPTCARHLERWLESFKPDAVLIEGPAVFNERVETLSDPEHEAPFALVAVARVKTDVVGRAYYPFCDYSPELVALRVARSLGAKPVFIDLVYGERGRRDVEGEESAIDGSGAEVEEQFAAGDTALARSRFTKELVTRSGCRDFDEVWESLFEQAGWTQTPQDWAADVTAYACLSREGYSQAELTADATLAREGCMAWHIAEAKKKHKKIAVITGAFHTAALRDSEPVKPGSKRTDGVETEVFAATYTFPRLDALLGYASGMSGPQFYQHVWDARGSDDPFRLAAQRVLVEASRAARQDGEVLGTADGIAALAFARQLADFRGRPHVGRVEVIEAALTCFVKGDVELVGQRLKRALAEAMRGSRVGKLGPSAGQAPLVLDFRRRLTELRLPVEHGRPDDKTLDMYGSALDLAGSRFLHQCVFLETPFATCSGGPDLVTGENLQLKNERWRLQYTPEIEARLSDLAHLGATVEDVAAALLVNAYLGSDGKSEELSRHLLRGLVMGLHRPLERLVGRLAAAMFSDDDVLSLLAAGALLRTVLRGRERLEAAGVHGLPQLARQAFLQGALRLERLAGFGPDRIDAVLAGLSSLVDVVLTEPELAPSRDLILNHALAARAAARGRAPALLGAIDGFLLQLGEGGLGELASTLRTLARGSTKHDGLGAYLEGVLSVARHALLGDTPLLDALLEYVRDSEWDEFVAAMPSLRRAFTRLNPRETDALATRASKVLGISTTDATALLGVSPELVGRLTEWEHGSVQAERTWAGGDR